MLVSNLPIIGGQIKIKKDYNYMMSSAEKAELIESGEIEILRNWEKNNPDCLLTPEIVKQLLKR